MKINIGSIPKSSKKRVVVPVIPFERPQQRELQRHEVLTFRLRSVPQDHDSTTYELTLPFFKQGAPETLLLLLNGIRQVVRGQNLTTGPQKYQLMRRMLEGDALAAFNRAATTATLMKITLGQEYYLQQCLQFVLHIILHYKQHQLNLCLDEMPS